LFLEYYIAHFLEINLDAQSTNTPTILCSKFIYGARPPAYSESVSRILFVANNLKLNSSRTVLLSKN